VSGRLTGPRGFLIAFLGGCFAAFLSGPAQAQVPTQIQLVGYATSSLSANAATSYSVTVPATVLVGDFMLFVGSNSPGSGGGAPSGWTFLASNTPTNTAIGFSLWYRIATATDAGASYTWTVTTASRVGGAISAFRGVDNTNPILDYGTAVTSANSLSRTAPSVTPGVANNVIVAIYSAANGNADTPSAPTGMTQIFAAGDADGVNGVFLSAFLETFAPAAASGTWVSASSSISAESVGGTVSLRPATVSPAALWHFDESTWNGTAGEVQDSGGSGYNAVAAHGAAPIGTSPPLSGSPGTCNYGTFNGSTQYVEMPGTLPRVGNEFTVTAWIKPTANQVGRIWMDDENYNGYGLSFYDSGSAKLRIYSRQPSTVYVDSSITLTLNTWYFVALVSDVTIGQGWYLIVFDSSGNRLDTVSLSRSSFSAGTGAHVTVGGSDDGETQGTLAHFAGNIDEVTMFLYDLPIPSLQIWALTTHPCAATVPNHYAVTTPGTAVNCAPAAVTIAAHSSTHAVLATTDSITLSSSTGHGDWTLGTGGGAFTAGSSNSGAASYTYAAADAGTAIFSLRDTYPESVKINVTDGSVTATSGTATSAEDSALTFAPSGFITTNGSNVATAIGTQVAGSTSTQALALQAVRTDTKTGACAFAFPGGTTKSIGLEYQCNNPTACIAGQTLTITNNGTTTAIASNPNSGVASYTAVPLRFSTANGEATISLTYSDAGQITLAAKYTIPLGSGAASANTMVGASQFVVQPSTLALSSIKSTASGTANPAASTASGTVFLGAGQAFSATVTALNTQGMATPNFGQETSPAVVTLVPALVVPAAGDDPSVSGAFNAFTGGIATGTGFSWPEVGVITLTPTVASYLGTTPAVTGTTTGNVGRFIPNAFAAATNTPLFSTACIAGGFGYVGQPFAYLVAPVITVTAQALGGATTKNYTGALMRLSNASLTGRTYTPTPSSPALTLTGLPATSADPAIADLGTGKATLTFSAGSGISFARGSAIAPFNANIALSINVLDSDGASASNPVSFGSGSGMAFSTGATQYYGRLNLGNALGSELLDLPMPLTTQYYASTTQGFVPNTQDTCTTAPALAFSNYQLNLSAGETCARDSGKPGVSGQGCTAAASSRYASPAVNGAFNLILAAPGSGNSGAVNVTPSAPTWLQYLWSAISGINTSPTGLATFGIFPGPASRIYQREVY